MSQPSSALYSPAAARAIDARAIGTLGVDGLTLMERAGQAAFTALRRRWPSVRRLAVVCGVGNNGGDGYVVARLALEAGLEAILLQIGGRERLSGDAERAAEAFEAAGGTVEIFAPERLQGCGLIVDAIFGTGLDRPVTGGWAEAIAAINAAGKPILALDIPSGLHGGTGAELGEAVRAELTVSFIVAKAGLYTGAGPERAGEVVVDLLALPSEAYEGERPCARLLDKAVLRTLCPPRPRDAHKGCFGHVLVLGGNLGMGGAARLAAEAALRCGAGLCTVATRPEHVLALLSARPELMVRGVSEVAELDAALARTSVLALGPGLGQDQWAKALWGRALQFDGPMVVDADALNLLAASPRRRDDWVLTPHPGEAARMLGTSTARVQVDRLAAAVALQERYGGVIVLKGAGTVVQGSDGLPAIARSGNPGMASGGMGDVLTGVIAALIAQGAPAAQAAEAGVQLHGAAADIAAADGERGLLALDLMPALRRLVNPA